MICSCLVHAKRKNLKTLRYSCDGDVVETFSPCWQPTSPGDKKGEEVVLFFSLQPLLAFTRKKKKSSFFPCLCYFFLLIFLYLSVYVPIFFFIYNYLFIFSIYLYLSIYYLFFYLSSYVSIFIFIFISFFLSHLPYYVSPSIDSFCSVGTSCYTKTHLSTHLSTKRTTSRWYKVICMQNNAPSFSHKFCPGHLLSLCNLILIFLLHWAVK